ncbi:hypothetical protein JKF63_04647 [Porcisia hertigi]|uniref:Uncharacterized protein n=1 Tax=Porcisia hertigi TaxID=2761500 RepID=A0A836ICX3_9TRYP|nr:hypothetical protein JKF63_04647 [Porcisia hertigi]
MYSAPTTVHRNRRPYPPQDTSKHYTEVVRNAVKECNPIYCAIKRLGPEIAFGDLEPAEKAAVLIAALLVVALVIGGPTYILRQMLS